MAMEPSAKRARTFKDIPTWDEEDEEEDAGAAEYAGVEELHDAPPQRKAAIKVLKASNGKAKAKAKAKLAASAKVAPTRRREPQEEEEWPEFGVEEEQGLGEEEEGLDWEGDDAAAAAAAVEANLASNEEQAWDEEAWDGEEGLDWEGLDASAAAAVIDADAAFESLNAENEQDGSCEEALLADLRADIAKVMPGYPFELEPFGSYVTNLGLPKSDEAARSDLDVVLLFHGEPADTIGDKVVRDRVVCPTLSRLGNFLRTKRGITVKNVILKARVPIVTFDTRELSVDISVQQPWGVLNSWHLKDLCSGGWPGRLRALVRLVKLWAQSKSVHSAKDGALSSYGYSILSASFLREIGAVPALLPKGSNANGPYLDSDAALHLVLSSCKKSGKTAGRGRTTLWKAPQPLPADSSEEAACSPAELFVKWLAWMQDTVLGFAGKGTALLSGCGLVPMHRRHIVSARPRTQAQLQKDVAFSAKFNEHWNPSSQEVFMVIEEPLNGENVGRCVRLQGFSAIRDEVRRARKELERSINEDGLEPMKAFKSLCELPPQSTRAQPRDGVGLGGKGGKGGGKGGAGAAGGAGGGYGGAQGVKRSWEAPTIYAADTPVFGSMGGAAASAAAKRWKKAAAATADGAPEGDLRNAASFGARLAFGRGYGYGGGGWG